MSGSRSESDTMIDSAVEGLDIITAYNQFAHKGIVDTGGKTEGIKISCPNPAHPDRNPSAWISTDKQTWFCAACNEGGDKYDIAAWHFGLPVPGYKVGAAFHDLRKKIAESQGYSVVRSITGKSVVVAPHAEMPPAAPKPVVTGATSAPIVAPGDTSDFADTTGALAVVTPIKGEDEFDERILEDIELNWRKIVPTGTFLERWMMQTTIDDVPEEYHFWNGMIAISMALGRDAKLHDSRPVYSNLFICILGKTGSGKSKSKYLFDQLMERALPYSATDPFSKGALRVASPASAEALIWTFQKKIEDPTAAKGAPPDLFPVKGVVDFNELSGMVGRAQRAGNVLTPTLMQFYDMENNIETVSRGHGVERAIEPFACAITTSQPKSLRGLLTTGDAASGFLNRWFFAVGKEKERFAVGGAIVDVEPAVAPLREILAWATKAKTVQWSQESLDMFTNFFHTQLMPIIKRDETDLLNRLDLLCKKLILILTANMKHKEVQVEAVEQMMMIFPYLVECYGVPGAQVGSTIQTEAREAILSSAIHATHKDPTLGITQGAINKLFSKRKHIPMDLVAKTLKYMIDLQEIVELNIPSRAGRPTRRFVVPDLAGSIAAYEHTFGSKITGLKAK